MTDKITAAATNLKSTAEDLAHALEAYEHGDAWHRLQNDIQAALRKAGEAHAKRLKKYARDAQSAAHDALYIPSLSDAVGEATQELSDAITALRGERDALRAELSATRAHAEKDRAAANELRKSRAAIIAERDALRATLIKLNA
jgi:hypothetical protein